MKKIKELYEKYKEPLLYIFFGVLTTLVNLVTFMLFEPLLGEELYLVSNLIAWVGAVIFAYVVNKLFVFSSRSWELKVVIKEGLEFLAARVFSFLLEEAGLFLFVDLLGFKKIQFKVLFLTITGSLIAKIILAVIVIILNYFFSKFIIFNKKSEVSQGMLKIKYKSSKKYKGTLMVASVKTDEAQITIPAYRKSKRVSEIGRLAFSGCTTVTEITLSEGICALGYRCFSECTSLKRVNLPETINDFCANAFEDCATLEEVNIPKSLKALPFATFQNCRSLKAISLPESLEKIGSHVFLGCSSLSEIELPKYLCEIGNKSFSECDSLDNLHIPRFVEKMGYEAFSSKNGIHLICHFIDRPEDWSDEWKTDSCQVEWRASIRKKTMDGEEEVLASAPIVYRWADIPDRFNTKRVVIPDGYTEVESRCFACNDRIEEIVFPPTVQYIRKGACNLCSGLKSITISEGVNYIGEEAFTLCESLERVVIPKSVNYIGKSAFSSCKSLKEVVILGDYVRMGEFCFSYCQSLESVRFEGIVEKIADYSFMMCKSLSSVTLPLDLQVIGTCAFYGCNVLKEISLPNGLLRIEDEAFVACEGLTEINLPASLEYCGSSIGSGIKNLTINCPQPEKPEAWREDWCKTTVKKPPININWSFSKNA